MPTMPIADASALAQYPHLFPPPGFINIDRNGLLAPVPIGGEQILETIQVTQGYTAWIRAIGLECTDWASGHYIIRVNSFPLRDYTNIVVPLGSPTTPKETFIKIGANDTLTLGFTASGPLSARWSLWGWQYAERS